MTVSVHLNAIIHSKDPRANSREMPKEKHAEIVGQHARETFNFILREEIPPDGNVLAIKVQ